MAPTATGTAIAALDYLHAPLSILYFLGALTFTTCTLQKANIKVESPRKRRLATLLLFVIVAANIAQAIFYFSHSLREPKSTAPDHSVIRMLGSILTWSIIAFAHISTKHPIWHPYLGAWLVGGSIETILLVVEASASRSGEQWQAPLALGSVRVAAFVALVIDGVFLLIESRIEKAADEERQSLLANNDAEDANGTPNATANKTYGSIENNSDTENEDEVEDRDKEIKEKRDKRLEEQGGWIGYLKGFLIFLPYIFPRHDWKGQLALAVLGLDIVFDRILNVLVPRQVGIITDRLTERRGAPYKEVILWGIMDWARSFAGFGMLKNIASTYINNYSYQKISELAFGHVMDLSMDFHSDKDSGEVLRAVEQAYALNDLIETVLFDVGPVLLDLCVAMWYVSYLFDVYLAFLILTIGILYVWMGITLTTWTQPARRNYVDKSRKESKTVYQSISNWQTVAYFNRGDYERQKYKSAIGTMISAMWHYMVRSYTNSGSQSFLMTFGFCGVMLVAIWEITETGKPVGNFVTLIMYWETMMSPLYTMAFSYRQLSASLIDAERLLQLLMTKATITNKDNAKTLVVDKARVEFKDVHFAYDARKEVIKDVNFVAEPGQTIAFVGETGGGKSTMLKLLFRFYDVTKGAVTIDGQDIRDVTISSLRDALGVVPQDPALFNQTIIENIRYSRLDATDEEIQEACKMAAVHDKIMTFPDGYKSKVGERGVKLSGGELQRVAIARVLIKNPRIVMLDEATSAVDSSTEAQIQEAFKKLSDGRTTFVVAHRLSTIMEADTILVVDHGEIIERGTHEELLKKGGKYLELWTKQTAKPSKPSSVKEDVLIKDIPDTKYSEELAKSFAADDEVATDNVSDSNSTKIDAPLIDLGPSAQPGPSDQHQSGKQSDDDQKSS